MWCKLAFAPSAPLFFGQLFFQIPPPLQSTPKRTKLYYTKCRDLAAMSLSLPALQSPGGQKEPNSARNEGSWIKVPGIHWHEPKRGYILLVGSEELCGSATCFRGHFSEGSERPRKRPWQVLSNPFLLPPSLFWYHSQSPDQKPLPFGVSHKMRNLWG